MHDSAYKLKKERKEKKERESSKTIRQLRNEPSRENSTGQEWEENHLNVGSVDYQQAEIEGIMEFSQA